MEGGWGEREAKRRARRAAEAVGVMQDEVSKVIGDWRGATVKARGEYVKWTEAMRWVEEQKRGWRMGKKVRGRKKVQADRRAGEWEQVASVEHARWVRAGDAIIENENNYLRPGLLLNIDIILDEIKDTMLIPEESVLTSKDYSYVFVIDENTAKLKKVSLGITSNGKIQILNGIESQDNVVTLGHEKLKDGSKIKIIEN